MKLKSILALASALTIAGTAAANAGTINLEPQGPGNFGSPNWSQTLTIWVDGNDTNVRAGLFRFQNADDIAEKILAFCIDARTNLNLGETFTTHNPSVDEAIDRLFTSSYADVNSAATATGFQVALWEVIEDPEAGFSGYDLDAGAFAVTSISSAARTAAETFLGRLATATIGGYTLTTYVNSGQDLISADPIPVPAAALLFAPALGAVAMRRKRKA